MLHLLYKFSFLYGNIHVYFHRNKQNPSLSATTEIRSNPPYCFFTVKNKKKQ